MKLQIQSALRRFGYEIHRVPHRGRPVGLTTRRPADLNPIWPLPRDCSGPSTEEIRREFAKYEAWHYAYEFECALAFPRRYGKHQPPQDRQRPMQRFRHFMPYLVDAAGGSLKGKRVLDIACNSGFWSVQCALLGADVVGFDARNELVEQAKLIQRIVGLSNVDFRVVDFWDMSRERLGGKFDVVLCLGILYHLPRPIEALRLVKEMCRGYVLLDTQLSPSLYPIAEFFWEEPDDIRDANRSGIVMIPSKSAIAMMLKEIGVMGSFEIPLLLPRTYPRITENTGERLGSSGSDEQE
jgi:tRNA (mo5U34)-methyltransferase